MTRSELKAQDEITTTIQSFGETAMARKKEIGTGAAVVLAVILIVFGWRYYAAGRDTAAQGQLGAVMAAFNDRALASDKERFEKTIVEAQKLLAESGSSHAASVGKYYMGLSQAGLGDLPNGVKNLEEAIAGGDTTIRPIAQFALAGVYKGNGEYQKAIDVLKQLEQSGGFSASSVAYEIGAAAEAAGQKDVAQTYYSKVVTDFSDSPFRADAESALKRMGLPVPAPAPITTPVTP
jgi:predicted negative regulator of RcsB-dependent stress response